MQIIGFVDHLEKCGLFSDFQNGFRSSQSTTDLLTVESDRISRVIDSSGATRDVALDILKAFNKVWYAGLRHKLKACICYFFNKFSFFHQMIALQKL